MGRLDGIEYIEDDIDIIQNNPPMKYVTDRSQNFDIHSDIIHIDFDGRSDIENCARTVQKITPRELILIGAEQERIQKFLEILKQSDDTAIKNMNVHHPLENGQIINANRGGNIYQLKLENKIVSKLDFQNTKGIEVAWIDGKLKYSSEESAKKAMERANMTDNERDQENFFVSKSLMPTLDALREIEVDGHEPVFINSLRLTNFKQVLIKAGFTAEFVAGRLIVNQEVALKNNQGEDNIELEGTITDTYYRVRDLLYSQYALV